MVQWAQDNIAKYKGNPDRMFLWAQSAGNGPLGIYLGRPELWGPKGVGVKGAISMSGQFNIAPLQVPGAGRGPAPNQPGGIFYGAGAHAARTGLHPRMDRSTDPAARRLPPRVDAAPVVRLPTRRP